MACTIFAAVSARAEEPEFDRAAARSAAERGAAWLVKQQSEEGAWHSETYGSLRDGAAVTALSLYAISHLPAEMRMSHRPACERAYAWLEPGIERRGYLVNRDGSPDFPTYGSSMTLTAVRRLELAAKPEMLEKLRAYILSEQLGKPRGFEVESIHYGGWDLLGAMGVIGRTSGTNVSITSFALEGLEDCSGEEYEEARRRALRWVKPLQSGTDGGFRFEADVAGLNNKALWHDEERNRPRSYGTVTCDGLHCLRLAGAPTEDAALRRAVAWIAAHRELDDVPGFEDVPPELGWQAGLRFYYYQSLGRALRGLPEEDVSAFRARLAARLLELQQPDGSWINDSARMREDDPLIATAFALTALGELLAE